MGSLLLANLTFGYRTLDEQLDKFVGLVVAGDDCQIVCVAIEVADIALEPVQGADLVPNRVVLSRT